jgi:hypothetical protein
MKYLVDKKTKEHRPYYGGSIEWAEDQGLDIVRADSEGWIAHTGDVCPLPDDVLCDTKWENWQGGPRMAAGHWKWRDPSITHYRPILAEKAQEPEPVVKESFTTGLLDRLKAAHEHAQQIPDLEAELREVLGSMGYDLVARSPFVEPEAAVETPQDMSDWRSWREGDFLTVIQKRCGHEFSIGQIVQIKTISEDSICCADRSDEWYLEDDEVRWHSRPAQQRHGAKRE